MEKESILKFRSLLHEGIVTFKYTKKDGTLREAKGTCCKKLEPIVETVKFEVTDIVFSDAVFSNSKIKPRKKTVLHVPEKDLEGKNPEEVHKIILDCLTAKFGAEVADCKHAKAESKQHHAKPDIICYYDVEKQGMRSFNESDLVSFEPNIEPR